MSERIFDHIDRDSKLHLSKHANEREHENADRQDFKIIGKGFRNCPLKCKIS